VTNQSKSSFFVHDFDAPGASILLIGAGASKSAPASAPLWGELQEDLVHLVARHAAELVAPQALQKLVRSLMPLLNSGVLAPESTLGILEANIGNMPLIEYLSRRLSCGAPNRNHLKVASLSKNGFVSAILTTNFDNYLELALESAAVPFKVASNDAEKSALLQEIRDNRHSLRFIPVVKLHGTVEEQDAESASNTQTIKAILKASGTQGMVAMAAKSSLIFSRYAAGRQLHSPNEEWFAFLRPYHLKVVGYSGNDRDIWPAILENMTAGSEVVWGVLPGHCPRQVQSASLKMSGQMEILEGDAYDFLCRIDGVTMANESLVPVCKARSDNSWDQDFLELTQPGGCLEGLAILAATLGEGAIAELEEVCNSLSLACPILTKAQCYRQLGFAKKDTDANGARLAFGKAMEFIRYAGDRDPREGAVCNRLLGATEASLGRIALSRGEIEAAIAHFKGALKSMESGDLPFATLGEPEHEIVYRKACLDLALAFYVLGRHEEAIDVADLGLRATATYPDSATLACLRVLRAHAESAVRGDPELDPSTISHLAREDRWEMVSYFADCAASWQKNCRITSRIAPDGDMLSWAVTVYGIVLFLARNTRLREECPRLTVDALMNLAFINETCREIQSALDCLGAAAEFCRFLSLPELEQSVEKEIKRMKSAWDWD
jgi:tetratricopeptide (TPR) repeat protein